MSAGVEVGALIDGGHRNVQGAVDFASSSFVDILHSSGVNIPFFASILHSYVPRVSDENNQMNQ